MLIDAVLHYNHDLLNRCGIKPTSIERWREGEKAEIFEKIGRVFPYVQFETPISPNHFVF